MRRKPEDAGTGAKGNAVAEGTAVDFLGYCFTRTDVRMRKRIKQTFARKDARTQRLDERTKLRAAYWGWAKWGKCRNLWNTITDRDMSFSDHGITGRLTTKDGHKYFDVPKIRIDSILNLPITVVDFETDVKTPHGPGRYAVKIIHEGTEKKVITNSITLKAQLDQIREIGKLPQATVIRKKETGGQFPDYYFE